MKGKVLIIYYHSLGYPIRKTNENMLYCFNKYSNYLCYYVNGAFKIPQFLKEIDFDLIIFHDLLLCKRSLPKRLRDFMKRAWFLKNIKGFKIAIVQDEFMQTTILNKFLNDFKINYIFSVASSSEWKKIYSKVDFKKVKIETILTGYLDEEIYKTVKKFSESNIKKNIDIGYRASSVRYSLGEHGYLKFKIGEIFKEKAKEFNLHADISNNAKDSFSGNDWYKFLFKCKYTIGIESGASVLDKDGKIEHCVRKLLSKYPNTTFEEAKESCFKKSDGNLKLFMLGPRHLEACATKTCQVLVEGNYNGILKPWKHYIPLKKDFSNIDRVLRIIKTDKLRKKIVKMTYRDIVLSGKYSYKNFTENIYTKSLGNNYEWKAISEKDRLLYKKNLKREKLLWHYIKFKSFFIQPILRRFPKKIIRKLESYYD